MDASLSIRWQRLLVTLLALALVFQAGAGVAAAQSFEGAADTIIVEEGQTYDSIQGVAGTIIVRGTVTGDVSGAAGTIHVTETGRIDGNIEAAAGTLRIDGAVGGDVSVGGGTVEVSDTAQISGNLESGSSFLRVDGTIDGDVRAGAETIVLGPSANIGGEFRYDAATFNRDSGATVAGGVVQDPQIGDGAGPDFGAISVPSWVGTIYGLFASLLLGAALLAVFPRFSAGVATRVSETPVVTGGVGLLTLVVVPLVLLIFAITIIGLPITIIGALAFGIAVWVGVVYGQYAVGSWAIGLAGYDNRWLALIVGLVGFALLGLIPFIGGLFDLLAFLLGLGALMLGLRDAYRSRGGTESGGRQTTLDETGGDTPTA